MLYFTRCRRLVDASLSAPFKLEVLDGICEVDFFILTPGLRNRAPQKLTCGPNEWAAKLIFPVARLLAVHKGFDRAMALFSSARVSGASFDISSSLTGRHNYRRPIRISISSTMITKPRPPPP